MANSDSGLITKKLLLSNNFNTRASKKIVKIIPHHAAGVTTIYGMFNTFTKRSASANYGLAKGEIALYVHEKDRAWTTSNSVDNEAVTIEISNSTGAPYWKVADIDIRNLILLSVDICKRNGMTELTWTGDKKGSLNFHYQYKATACPGPYIKALAPWIASEVTARVQGKKSGAITIPSVECINGKCILTSNISQVPAPEQTVPASNPATYIYQGVDLTPVFDANYYSDKYSDLKQAFGYNKELLFQHFCKYGMKEARQGCSTFNPQYYRLQYRDLDEQFGDYWIKYYAHYCIQGIKEGRKGI